MRRRLLGPHFLAVAGALSSVLHAQTYAWDGATGLGPEEAVPRWTEEFSALGPGCPAPTRSAVTGAVRIDASACGYSQGVFHQYWLPSQSGWSQPYSIEAEMRVVEPHPTDESSGFTFSGVQGGCGWTLLVGDGVVSLRYSGNPEHLVPVGPTDVFRTYRLEVVPAGNLATLYVDGQVAIAGVTGSNPLCGIAATHALRFGELGGPFGSTVGAISEWRRIEHDRALGAYEICADLPNSVARTVHLRVVGSNRVMDDSLYVQVEGPMLAGSAGVLLASRTATSGQVPATSSGRLCLSGAIGRFLAPGQLFPFGAAPHGNWLQIDPMVVPQPTGPVAVQPGESWSFQLWYRDANPQPTSNFSTAVTVLFE